eukprot:29496-Pelagococcus_subviridis.AAC.5
MRMRRTPRPTSTSRPPTRRPRTRARRSARTPRGRSRAPRAAARVVGGVASCAAVWRVDRGRGAAIAIARENKKISKGAGCRLARAPRAAWADPETRGRAERVDPPPTPRAI